MTDFRETLRGIVAMLLCCLFFLINDTIVKAVADDSADRRGAFHPVGHCD